jgi:hypothetical protein
MVLPSLHEDLLLLNGAKSDLRFMGPYLEHFAGVDGNFGNFQEMNCYFPLQTCLFDWACQILALRPHVSSSRKEARR